jgi:hypothetical protein
MARIIGNFRTMPTPGAAAHAALSDAWLPAALTERAGLRRTEPTILR